MAMTFLSCYSFCQETLQSVTDRGAITTQTVFVTGNARTNGTPSGRSLGMQYEASADCGDIFAYDFSSSTYKNISIAASGGNVGIGTNSPAYKLDVNGEIGTSRLVVSNVGGGITWPSSGSYAAIDVMQGADMIFYNGMAAYNERMRILGNGNIGIGTSNPGVYKLAVEGTVGARKIKVTQETWADYVFDSAYQLPSLTHVETFIKENKHLPEVPSAANVKKDGLDLGDNQVVLLKKIEELTLYIIQQNKKMEIIERRLAEVETKQSN